MKRTRTISALIRNKRAEYGISQDKLASQLGYKNGQFISNVERDKCGFPPKFMHKLSKIINVSTVELVDAFKTDYSEYIEGTVANQVKEFWQSK